ncbi:hypothetical protein [Morganella morganii IS15]|nr:hypothetical protein CSB69_3635 [Morganella morganii]EMP52580.1 hypothetical protein C790_03553 [Morganella morganii SC01]ETO43273.1 hypothetical protein X965_16915 [Morganella sp. EGD-HP17]CDK68087.1 hypothetical protein [Morganella morganii IS15]
MLNALPSKKHPVSGMVAGISRHYLYSVTLFKFALHIIFI